MKCYRGKRNSSKLLHRSIDIGSERYFICKKFTSIDISIIVKQIDLNHVFIFEISEF